MENHELIEGLLRGRIQDKLVENIAKSILYYYRGEYEQSLEYAEKTRQLYTSLVSNGNKPPRELVETYKSWWNWYKRVITHEMGTGGR